MSSTFRIDYVEAALLALLTANLPNAYGSALPAGSPQIVMNGNQPTASIDIDSLGDKDFDENGQLVLNPPSIRVRFLGGNYDMARDNQKLTYQSPLVYELLCFESSLRSKADQRNQTLILVSVVLDQLAGARLNLTDGSKTEPIRLVDVSLIEGAANGVDQLFSAQVEIRGFAQFSGANANRN